MSKFKVGQTVMLKNSKELVKVRAIRRGRPTGAYEYALEALFCE